MRRGEGEVLNSESWQSEAEVMPRTRSSRTTSPGKDRVTVDSVAAAAGVSRATASYALTGRGAVAEATRERVLYIAKQMGYKPRRPRQRTMPEGTRPVVTAVMATTGASTGEAKYYALQLLAGAEAVLRTNEIALQIEMGYSDRTIASLGDPTSAGALFLGGLFPTDLGRTAPKRSVLVGTFYSQWPYDAVLADNARGMYLGAVHCLCSGRLTVGLINGPTATRTSAMKVVGYRDALEDFGRPYDPKLVRSTDFSANAGYVATRDLIASEPELDALLVADDTMATGSIHALNDLGRRIPDDVAVIGYGDSPLAEITRPMLSSVRVFQNVMGSIGAQQLISRLGDDKRPYSSTLIQPELIIRKSSDPANPKILLGVTHPKPNIMSCSGIDRLSLTPVDTNGN